MGDKDWKLLSLAWVQLVLPENHAISRVKLKMYLPEIALQPRVLTCHYTQASSSLEARPHSHISYILTAINNSHCANREVDGSPKMLHFILPY